LSLRGSNCAQTLAIELTKRHPSARSIVLQTSDAQKKETNRPNAATN
jgi:hypothetical protein